MFLLFLLALPFVLLAVAVFGLLVFAVTLPFRILGFLFHVLGVLVALPVLALVGVVVFGALLFAALLGLVALALPALPVVLAVAGLVWLARRAARRPAHAV